MISPVWYNIFVGDIDAVLWCRGRIYEKAVIHVILDSFKDVSRVLFNPGIYFCWFSPSGIGITWNKFVFVMKRFSCVIWYINSIVLIKNRPACVYLHRILSNWYMWNKIIFPVRILKLIIMSIQLNSMAVSKIFLVKSMPGIYSTFFLHMSIRTLWVGQQNNTRRLN